MKRTEFKDGGRQPPAKENRHPVDTGEGKEMGFSLNTWEEIQPTQHLEFNPMRSVLNF